MNTDYKTMIVLLPTSNKSKTYEELRTSVINLIGSVYENKSFNSNIDNTDSLTPENCIAYNKQLDDEEKNAIDNMCNESGILALFIEGTTSAFDKVNHSKIITIIIEENKED